MQEDTSFAESVTWTAQTSKKKTVQKFLDSHSLLIKNDKQLITLIISKL